MKNLVWLASYPRSGNTWFRLFLSSILSGNSRKDLNQIEVDLLSNSRRMFDELAGITSSELANDEINNLKPAVFQLLSCESTDHQYLKTHDRFFLNSAGYPVFPQEYSFGCVYIIRNPLDVAVSNAHYFSKPVDEVIAIMNNRGYALNVSIDCLYPLLEEWIGDWSGHATSWLNSGVRVHVIRYEDMISFPVETFSKALKFLKIKFTEERVSIALSETSFETIKKSEEQFGFKEKLQSCNSFFRQGKAGGWKTFLTELQIRKIAGDHREVMERFGYLEPGF
ncbi:MAG: sulfotransferase domain-containing protein [Bacteroidetes bacterium]|nr:sulfotransferase domain-containing protein [Bacteroidota bacterium]